MNNKAIGSLVIAGLIAVLVSSYVIGNALEQAYGKPAPVVKEETKYEYSIGQGLYQTTPVKYCHIMNGALYVMITDKITFTTTNPLLICKQEEI